MSAYVGYVKVIHAESKGEKENPHGGLLYRWNLELDTKDSEPYGDVFWQRKSSEPITVGDQFHGEISKGDYGWRFKLTSPETSGPRSESTTNHERGSAGGTDTVRPDAAANSADTGGAYWDTRSARIERQHSQEMALRWTALMHAFQDGPTTIDDLTPVIDWFVADLDNASSQNTRTPPPPATGGAASDSGPARHSEADPPPPASDLPPERTATGPPASDNPPVTPNQKGKVTKALNEKIATVHHDALRFAYGAERRNGARNLWVELERLDAGDVDAFLTKLGITPASDLPADDGDLPSADDIEKRGAELGMTVADD